MRLARAAPALFILGLAAPAARADLCGGGAVPTLDDRCESWVGRYDNPGGYVRGGKDIAFQVAAGGGRVFVTGRSEDDATGGYDAYTIAYEQETGKQVWATRYNDEASGSDSGNAVALSPDARRVYVTGYQGKDLLLLAYDAATGTQQWKETYHDDRDANDVGVALDTAEGRVYVAGIGYSTGDVRDFVAVAFEAGSGKRLWASRYDGPAGLRDEPVGIAASRSGGRVVVGGVSRGAGPSTNDDYAVVAYDAGLPDEEGNLPPTAGQQLWASRYDGPAGNRDTATAFAMSPDGSRVFVTGQSQTAAGGVAIIPYEFGTVAYATEDGRQLWIARHRGPSEGLNVAYGLGVDPAGDRVYVTGAASGLGTHFDQDYGTVAYDAGTGRQLWASTYQLPGFIYEHGRAVAAGAQRVYVFGFSGDGVYKGEFSTVAYEAGTGSQAWAARYNTVDLDRPFTRNVVVDAGRVFTAGYLRHTVAGFSCTNCNEYDYTTLAYQA